MKLFMDLTKLGPFHIGLDTITSENFENIYHIRYLTPTFFSE
ncbi:hypothetical protein MADA3029_270056 [Vibrio nigripulchritudo MADA3029]|nr:hypothetical protein VIBNIMADA3020_420056 [Vibrio nigripulchritudo MADA3020]CCN56558.1 hypothetical protein VIBNIMADA3021_970053 [Vibrio nigripulchritudo MADA3021]CCN58819.1 hypothetical protein MADA3029_270056 [Vibrio nigripulchritudo MADA3029]